MKKTSLLKRLKDTVSADTYDDFLDDDEEMIPQNEEHATEHNKTRSEVNGNEAKRDNGNIISPIDDGLSVDVYQTNTHVVVKAFVPGIIPSNLDVEITREMITISGTREEARETEDENYFHQELYWGSFSRTILLPSEIDVDGAEASEKHGILIIRLPKINKKKATKLKVKSR